MDMVVGVEFVGVFLGMTFFLVFVLVKVLLVDGVISIANVEDDFYIFDEVRMVLTGRRTGRSFRIGQEVKVQLAGANAIKRQLDFRLISRADGTRIGTGDRGKNESRRQDPGRRQPAKHEPNKPASSTDAAKKPSSGRRSRRGGRRHRGSR
jgi:ribonuclease R